MLETENLRHTSLCGLCSIFIGHEYSSLCLCLHFAGCPRHEICIMSPQRAETADAVTTTGLTEPVQARAWPGEAGVSSHGMISYQQLTGFNQPVDTINQERDHTEQATLSKDIDTDS